MLLGIALAMAVAVILSAASSYAAGKVGLAVIAGTNLAVCLLVLVLLRYSSSVVVPAMLVLLWGTVSMGIVSASEGGLFVAACSWVVLLILVSFLLVGARLGMLICGLLVIQAAVAVILHVTDNQLPLALTATDEVLSNGLMVLGFACAGIAAYKYASERQRTLDELSNALTRVERDESQLTALVDHSTVEICSVDRSGCLQVFTRAFARSAHAQRGVEPSPGDPLDGVVSAEQMARWQPCIDDVLTHVRSYRIEEQLLRDGEPLRYETSFHPMLEDEHPVGVVIFSRDITARKRSEAEMTQLHAELMTLSRHAGLATVASEVMHNAGNILNSVNLSGALLQDQIDRFQPSLLREAIAPLGGDDDERDAYLREDPRGRRLPEVLRAFADHLVRGEADLRTELSLLREGVIHLTRIIRAQHDHARNISVVEEVSVGELVKAALAFSSGSWEAYGIEVEQELAPTPRLYVDKHRVLEILVNLLNNAFHALRDAAHSDKRLRIRTQLAGEDRVVIEVEDNGVGIFGEARDKLFRLGFTTKETGHGLGLHSSANAAAQLGGSLTGHSDGAGKGAVFRLEIPIHPAATNRRVAAAPPVQ